MLFFGLNVTLSHVIYNSLQPTRGCQIPYTEIQCSTIETFLLGSDVYFTFSEFAGIRNTGKMLGLGDNLRVELNR